MAEAPRCVLFVDDEPNVIRGLRRMLHDHRSLWDGLFVTSATEALKLLSTRRVDVIVSDLRMPEMGGVALLDRVRDNHPDVVRVILSGSTDRQAALSSSRSAHQFLPKPCDSVQLLDTLERALGVKSLFDNPRLARLLTSINELPPTPKTYFELTRLLSNPETTISTVAATVAQDPAITAQVLRYVNSAYFGLSREVKSALQAVSLLGTETLKWLVFHGELFGPKPGAHSVEFNSAVEKLGQHSQWVSTLARRIVRDIGGSREQSEEVAAAGILHDVGWLVLLGQPDLIRALHEQSIHGIADLIAAELEVFGATHAELGAYLLGLWGLPDRLVHLTLHHHSPCWSGESPDSSLFSLHVADSLVGEVRWIEPPHYNISMDTLVTHMPKYMEHIQVWQAAADEIRMGAKSTPS
jgi:HD-like signal output (HDOD) protein